MRARLSLRLVATLCAALAASPAIGPRADAGGPPPSGWPPPPASATVVSVYDGDTFTLDTGDKVRLRWVNTPEMKPEEPIAREARAFTESFVLQQAVQLRTSGNARDSYGRIVAGITTDRGDLTLALLEEGLGHAFFIPPEEGDTDAMLAAQERARAAQRGIWATETYQGELHMTSFHANGRGDDATNPNGEYMRICNIASTPVRMSDFKLRNQAGQEFSLPPILVPPGHTVKVMSGRGTVQGNPMRQLEIYLGQDAGVWDDEHEVVELINAKGVVIDFRAAGH
jgi:endonuclease YncB( thermonuclease family)